MFRLPLVSCEGLSIQADVGKCKSAAPFSLPLKVTLCHIVNAVSHESDTATR